MSEESKREALKKLEEVYKGKLDALKEVYTADCIVHREPGPVYKGLESLKKAIAEWRKAFPDTQMTVDELILVGDKGAALFTIQGTHKEQTAGFPFPPTGRKVKFRGASILRFKGDKIAEEISFGDNLGLLQQLGVIQRGVFPPR